MTATVRPGEEVNKANLRVTALPQDQREKTLAALMDELREALRRIPGLTYNLREVAIAGAGQEAALQAPITVHVQCTDYDEPNWPARGAPRKVHLDQQHLQQREAADQHQNQPVPWASRFCHGCSTIWQG